MADLNDSNKPDGTSNYSTEVWQTVRGHIARLWAGDYTSMANLAAGMRRWVNLGSGNAKLVQRNSGGTEDTIFDSSTKANKGANNDITSLSGLTTPLSQAQGGTGQTSLPPNFPTGTRMPFAQAAAPTGWTQDTTDQCSNRMMRVVEVAGNGIGGVHNPLVMNVVPAHTHGFTTGTVSSDHSHAMGDPGHGHIFDANSGAWNGSDWVLGRGEDAASTHSTRSTATGVWTQGISSNHTHSGGTDNGSSQTNWQPRYIDLIICSKN